jgi:hypothetical protein
LSHDELSSYNELGGIGLPAVYINAIKNPCSVCGVTPGVLCLDDKGNERKRPHGSRMVVRTTGESAPKVER